MKYLFTYIYGAKKDGFPTNGQGSITMSVTGTDKITEKMIFGEKGSIEITEEKLREEGLTDVKVAPMGWFKFDEEDET